MENYIPHDQSFITELAAVLRQEYSTDEIKAMQDKYLEDPWPSTYINSDTGRVYTPHHELEAQIVYSDGPYKILGLFGGEGSGKTTAMVVKTLDRLKRGCSGIMACVAAETLVDGVPIAERTKPGLVNTATGLAWASPSFCEGRADLFRVITQRGDQVLATSSHRFLTPTGWHRLRDLRAGSLIAVDDSENGKNWREIQPNFVADYYLGLHPYDEYAKTLEQYDLSKWLRLALLWEYFAPFSFSTNRVCIDHSSPRIYLDGDVMECQLPCEVDEHDFDLNCVSRKVPQVAYRTDSLQAWCHCRHLPCVDNAVGMANDQFQARQYQLNRPNSLFGQRFPAIPSLGHTVQPSSRDQTLLDDQFLPYSNYTIAFQKVQEIKFERHGEFYGLVVPGPANYIANGIVHHNSPDLEHGKKSLWPEFCRWCPWERVIDRHQFMREPGWMPREYFEIVFRNALGTYSTLGFGGCPESEIMKWEGPNINFAHLDEMRRHKTPAALKVFTGRVRITGPGGIPPQIYFSTTPSKHWLYEYFGPLACTCQDCGAGYEWDLRPNTKPICPKCQSTNFRSQDRWKDFKLDAAVVRLRTQDNESNLYEGFAKDRALSLTEAEARVLLDAEWEDLADTEHFLPSMTMWDLCRSDDIPPLSPNDPLVIGVDAAKGRTNDYSDCFAIVAVSRHWDRTKRRDHVVVRYVQTWQAKSGRSIQLVADKSRNQPDGPEDVLARLIKDYNVVQVAYDPYQMADLGQRFKQKRMAWMKEFGQISERTEADSDLLQLIMSRRIVHNGDATLREHIENADRKVSDDGNKIRIVKRLDSLKVDAAVALSMACKRCLYLNIGNLSTEDGT